MPIYDYYCPKCECAFECIQFPGERVTCPHCGCSEVSRRPSAPSSLIGIKAAKFKKSEAKKKRVNDIVKRQTED